MVRAQASRTPHQRRHPRPEQRPAGLPPPGRVALPQAAAPRVLLRHDDHAGVPVQRARGALHPDLLRQARRAVEVPLLLRRLPVRAPGAAHGDVLQPAQGADAAGPDPPGPRRAQGHLRPGRSPAALRQRHDPDLRDRDDPGQPGAAGRPDRPLPRLMKIALVGPAHPYKGGGARHTTELAHRLAAAGHDVIIESWRAQYPSRLYPGQQTVDVSEGEPYPRTHRRLAWYRPDGWLADGRRLRPADLVVFAYLTPLQAPSYLAVMAGLRRHARTAVICHNVLPHERRPGDVPLTRALPTPAATGITHSPAQPAQARDLAPAATVRTVAMPPHLPGNNQGTERAEVSAPAPTAVLARGDDPPEPPALLTGGTHPPGPPLGETHPPGPPLHPARLLFFGIVRPYKGLDV